MVEALGYGNFVGRYDHDKAAQRPEPATKGSLDHVRVFRPIRPKRIVILSIMRKSMSGFALERCSGERIGYEQH
jgi:hypothetical protein